MGAGVKEPTDSAESLSNNLKLEYHKLRQGNITKELLGDCWWTVPI